VEKFCLPGEPSACQEKPHITELVRVIRFRWKGVGCCDYYESWNERGKSCEM